MATYWVPDLPNIKGISGRIRHSTLILWVLEKSQLPWEQNFFIAVGVFFLEQLAYQVSMVCTAN